MWLFKRQRASLDPDIEFERALIRECTKIIRWKASPPMAKFFARIRRGEAKARLALLAARQDDADADGGLRDRLRRRFPILRSPHDPMTPEGQRAPQQIKRLCGAMPPMVRPKPWMPD